MVVTSQADRVLARAVELGDVPGVVAMATDERDSLYEGAFGRRTTGESDAMRLDTIFAIASMTKAITAVAAMQLVERGAVTLDESLADRLPPLARVHVLDGFDAAGAPRLRPPRRPITLRHLLTHTAGFAYAIWNTELSRLLGQNGAPFAPLAAPMVFDPGERWEYGINIDWVGRLVEHLSGQTLEEYFRENILDPLGMRDTGFLLDPARRARLAGRHQRQPDGSLRQVAPELPDRPAFFNGGGGLYSTGSDYLRFLRMLLGGGQLNGARLLQPATVAEMGRNQIGDLAVGVLRTTSPALSNDAEVVPGAGTRWGLAGAINTEQTATGRSAGSWAWAGLYNTYFWVDPTRRVAGLVLTQILPFCDGAVLRVLDGFERAVYAMRHRAGDQTPSDLSRARR